MVASGKKLACVDEAFGHAAMKQVGLDPSHGFIVHILVDWLGAVCLEVLLEEVLVVRVASRAEADVAERE